MQALYSLVALLVLAVVAKGTALATDKNRPVSKVINLLKDLQVSLQKEQEEDESVYEKLSCWCTTNDAAKTKAIAEAEARISSLTGVVEEATATSARLDTEIKQLEKEIAANEAALAQATDIRHKELAQFNGEEKDMLQSIQALKAAITVLSKHHAPPKSALVDIASILHHHMHTYDVLLQDRLTHNQRRTLEAFIQQPDHFSQSATFKQAYAPQSGEVFGILENMLDTFTVDAKEADEEEAAKEQSYQDLKAAKQAEISAATESKETKKAQLADTENRLATAKQDIADTRESLGADQRFLVDLQAKCSATDAEWAERQKTRAEETEAVAKAVAILSGDDAHDLFTRTFNNGASFVQMHAKVVSYKRSRVAALLKRVARRVGDSHTAALLQIAGSVQLDAFTEVKTAIDALVEGLLKEGQDEIKHRDWCNVELNQNAGQTAMKQRDQSDLQIKIDSLTQQADALTKEVAVLEAEIAELQKQVQAAGEDREKQNLDFQATVTDAQETQKLLTQATEVLKSFYAKTAFVQADPAHPEVAVAPTKFDTYKKQGGSGVISLLEAIIQDSANLEKEAIQAEQDSQAAYETFVRDSNASIEAKQRDVTNKQETKAQAEADLNKAKEDLARVGDELASLAEYVAQVHTACDFVLKNFDVRQSARSQEVEALRQAKAILSGMQSE